MCVCLLRHWVPPKLGGAVNANPPHPHSSIHVITTQSSDHNFPENKAHIVRGREGGPWDPKTPQRGKRNTLFGTPLSTILDLDLLLIPS